MWIENFEKKAANKGELILNMYINAGRQLKRASEVGKEAVSKKWQVAYFGLGS